MNNINITINQQNSKENIDVENKKIIPWREISLLVFIIIGVITSFIINSKPTLLDTSFWIIAFIWSGFLGVYAFQLHTSTDYEKINSWPIRTHQFIFNFGLAILGWIILYNLLPLNNIFIEMKSEKLALLGIAIISLSGYLPKLVSLNNPFK